MQNEHGPPEDIGLVEGETGYAPPLSPTVLNMDFWGLRKGRECSESELLADYELDPHAAADLHASLFEPGPEFAANPQDELRAQFVHQLFENTDFVGLREQTVLDVWASETAMVAVSEQWTRLKKESDKRQEQQQQPGKKGGKQKPQIPLDVLAGICAGKAARQAQQAVDDAQEAADAFGLEKGPGGQLDMQAVRKLLQKTARDPNLKRIVELAGRFRRLAAAKQRTKVAHGMDDMVGVVMDGDIPRLLPQELVQLKHPVLRLDAMRRIVEREALCRQHRGIERVARGPVMVWVDESGSMQGERIATAKALGLAMAWIARKQKRWCSLVGFSSQGELHALTLPPGKWDQDAVIGWCGHFFAGGTQVPFADAERLFAQTAAPRGKTDILLVTDGETYLDPHIAECFLMWKKENKARLISLILDCAGNTVAPLSDELYQMKSLSVAEEGVQAAVSI